MMGPILRGIRGWWERLWRGPRIPPPPFRASKRVAVIMNGLWYGRLSPQQARERAAGWGFSAEQIEDMIERATQPPSYWSRPADRGDG